MKVSLYPKPKDQNYLRFHNTRMLLEVVAQKHPATRAEIAKITKMSPTSIGRIVADLQECGFLRETGEYSTGLGRRGVMLDLEPNALYSLGLSIDSDRLQVCLVNYLSEVVALEERVLTGQDCDLDHLIRIGLELYYKIITQQNIPANKVIGLGVCIVGVVSSGQVLLSPQFSWKDIPLAQAFENVFHMHTVVENDVKASLLGEMHLQNILPETNTAILNIGSGVGSAAIIDGLLVRGRQNAAGEVGHIIIERQGGVQCECGRQGCLQTHLARQYIVDSARRSDPEVQTPADIKRACDAGKPWAVELLEDCKEHICLALDIITAMYNPNAILMGGSFFSVFTDVIPRVIKTFNDRVLLPADLCSTTLVVATQEQTSVLGCALLAKKAFLSQYLQQRLANLESA